MKKIKYLILVAYSIFFICATTSKETLVLCTDYKVIISGTSNIHNWTETVEKVSGGCDYSINSDGSSNIDNLAIFMDVYSIKSEHGAVMNKNTYKALKAKTFPQITFLLNNPIRTIPRSAVKKNISAKGKLTIAGITNLIDVNIDLFMKDDKTLSVVGAQKIKMSDYGIKPPTALGGTIKTGNEITLNFKTNFILKDK